MVYLHLSIAYRGIPTLHLCAHSCIKPSSMSSSSDSSVDRRLAEASLNGLLNQTVPAEEEGDNCERFSLYCAVFPSSITSSPSNLAFCQGID
jgi:hypothetical protein